MQRSNRIVLVTGGFDPLHSGHIEYFQSAKQLGNKLVVGLNSDKWLARKKGQPFMPLSERLSIVKCLNMVDEVITFNDDDNSSINAILETRKNYPDSKIIFANGGDRTVSDIPEMSLTDDSNLEFVFGIGGTNKKNSSSWILEEWKNPKTIRPWGWYRVLDDKDGYKVKELVVQPGKSLSFQKHSFRSEHWYILKGECDIVTEYNNVIMSITKYANDTYIIEKNVWHQCQNNYDYPCHVLEVQYGEKCIEEDIERK